MALRAYERSWEGQKWFLRFVLELKELVFVQNLLDVWTWMELALEKGTSSWSFFRWDIIRLRNFWLEWDQGTLYMKWEWPWKRKGKKATKINNERWVFWENYASTTLNKAFLFHHPENFNFHQDARRKCFFCFGGIETRNQAVLEWGKNRCKIEFFLFFQILFHPSSKS